jgi:hypothetical protein
MNDPRNLLTTLAGRPGPTLLATLLEGGRGDAPLGAWAFLEPPAPGAPGPAAAVLADGRPRMADRAGASSLPWPEAGRVLLERLLPGQLPPWLHVSALALGRGEACVLATVTAATGTAPCHPGERFVYDQRNHGLLPVDGRFSLELQRAALRARAAGTPGLERITVPGGEVEAALQPFAP